MTNRQILFLSLFTLITVLAWIGFDVYHVLTTSTIKAVDAEMIRVLVPDFETNTILELKKNNQL